MGGRQGQEANFNQVGGNQIGWVTTKKLGDMPLPNGEDGVLIASYADFTTVGGPTEGRRNVISGNGGNGVSVKGIAVVREGVVSASKGAPQGTMIVGNYIGTTSTGMAGVDKRGNDTGNAGHGIFIEAASGTVVGGSPTLTAT